MLEFLHDTPHVRLSVERLDDDYSARFAAADGHPSWKLERQQHFREREFVSWDAFDRGDWDEAMRLLEDEREGLADLQRDADARGVPLYRVRVVEEPIIPYLQWELHLLHLREQYGELIRVVGPEQVREFEDGGQLPELLTIGADTLYRFLYDETESLSEIVRYDDPTVVKRCNEFIGRLYAVGVDLADYFARKVAPLEPPRLR